MRGRPKEKMQCPHHRTAAAGVAESVSGEKVSVCYGTCDLRVIVRCADVLFVDVESIQR